MGDPKKQPPEIPPQAPPAAPPPAPKAPAERRAAVHDVAREQLDDLRNHPILRHFAKFIQDVEQGSHDFEGDDSNLEELQRNPTWLYFQETLKTRLSQEYIPPGIDQSLVDRWAALVFDGMKQIISYHEGREGRLTKSDINLGMTGIFGSSKKQIFLEWCEKNGGETYKNWKKKQEAAVAQVSGLREPGLQNLATERAKLVGAEFKALQDEGVALEQAIRTASDEATLREAAINKVAQFAALVGLAIIAKGTIDEAASEGAKLTLFPERVQQIIGQARQNLGQAKTAEMIDVAKTGVAIIADYAKLHEQLLTLPEPERQEILKRIKEDPNFVPMTELQRLEERIAAEQAAFSVQAGRETMIPRKWLGYVERIKNPQIKHFIYGAILGIASFLGMLPWFGKSWRRAFVGNDVIARMAAATEDVEQANNATWEYKAETIFYTQRLSQDTTDALLDTTVEEFLSNTPQTYTSDSAEILSIQRLQRAMQNPQNGLDVKTNAKVRLALAIGSQPKFSVEPPPAAPPAAAQAQAETPEAKTANFLDQQIKDLTGDEKTNLANLTLKDVVTDNKRPQAFNEDRWKKLAELLRKNKAQEKSDTSMKVLAFFQEIFGQGNNPEVLT